MSLGIPARQELGDVRRVVIQSAVCFGVPAAGVAVTALLRWLLDPCLGDQHPFVLFLVPVLVPVCKHCIFLS